MTISYVGGATAEATSVTLPTHQAGDLIVIVASRSGSTTFPTPPSGWFLAGNRSAAGVNLAMAIGFKVAVSNGETSGTWTNAELLLVAVYRHTTNFLQLGGWAATATNTSTTISYLGTNGYNTNIAGRNVSASSWHLAALTLNANNTTGDSTPPSMTTRVSLAGTGNIEAALHDTGAFASSFSGRSITSDISVGYVNSVVEIYDTGISKAGGKPILPFTQGVIG